MWPSCRPPPPLVAVGAGGRGGRARPSGEGVPAGSVASEAIWGGGGRRREKGRWGQAPSVGGCTMGGWASGSAWGGVVGLALGAVAATPTGRWSRWLGAHLLQGRRPRGFFSLAHTWGGRAAPLSCSLFFSFFLSLPVPLGRTGGVPVARGRGAAAPRRRQTAARQRSTPPLFSIPLTDGSVPRPWPFPPPPHGWVRAPSVCPSLPHRSPAAAADAGGPRRQRGSPYPGIGWGVAEIHRGGHVGGTVQAQNLPRPAPASRTGGNGHARGVERGGGGREGGRAGGGRGEGREGLPFAAR